MNGKIGQKLIQMKLPFPVGVYLTGEVKIFSEDGDLQTIRRYKEGLLDVEMATYHPNGTHSQ